MCQLSMIGACRAAWLRTIGVERCPQVHAVKPVVPQRKAVEPQQIDVGNWPIEEQELIAHGKRLRAIIIAVQDKE